MLNQKCAPPFTALCRIKPANLVHRGIADGRNLFKTVQIDHGESVRAGDVHGVPHILAPGIPTPFSCFLIGDFPETDRGAPPGQRVSAGDAPLSFAGSEVFRNIPDITLSHG